MIEKKTRLFGFLNFECFVQDLGDGEWSWGWTGDDGVRRVKGVEKTSRQAAAAAKKQIVLDWEAAERRGA